MDCFKLASYNDKKMTLSSLDWTLVGIYFVFILLVGLYFSKKSGTNLDQYFLSGRNMPWWLLGLSMVATTFSADTPNLVTELVRQDGVSGNWVWWAFLVTGMVTVFIYSKLWRRSMVLTDIEFYELRYSGKLAGFLRGFRALYLGLVFNVLVMGAVSLAAIKFGEIILGLEGWQTLLIAGSITILYTYFGGLRAILVTDFVQFILAMIGSIWACIYLVNIEDVGGITALLSHENVVDKLSFFPSWDDPSIYMPIIIVPLAVQWWASYYPGAEPGGGGYIAQRMFSAKNEKNAVGATLLFNIAHYALRPWPWILIAFASLIIFPEVADIQQVFPGLSDGKLGDDIAYPAMLTLLPSGLLGLVAASLIAAFMSTMSTQMNLGSSYLVNDFYKRFVDVEADDKKLVRYARMFTLISGILGMGLGLKLTSAKEAFDLLLILGAGTGLLYILRWFWWRINAMCEIVAMVASIVVGVAFIVLKDILDLAGWHMLIIGTLITTTAWVITAFVTSPTDDSVLMSFYNRIRPNGIGWDGFLSKMRSQGVEIEVSNSSLGLEIILSSFGIIGVYCALFATGNFIYGKYTLGLALGIIAVICLWFVISSIRGKMDVD